MDNIKTIVVNRSAYANNDLEADLLRDYLFDHRTFLINVMSSPGAGKTTTLIKLINSLKDTFKIGVMEADIDGDVDADRIHKLTGVPSIQVHTSGACHLTAQMVEDAINSFDITNINLLILENVGNLVCPAEFDTGAHLNLVLLSIPEGDDKPLKYPLMFEVANIVAITKMDTLPAFNFDIDKCRNNIHLRNKDIEVYPISALKDQGVDELYNALLKFIKK